MVYTPDHSREQDEVDARVKANGDIRRLVALVKQNKVMPAGERTALRAQVERLLGPIKNPTIRPNAKKARKTRRTKR